MRDHPYLLLLLTFVLAIAAVEPTMAETPAVPPVVHNQWSSGASMPIAVWCPMVGLLNGKIYVVGGTNTDGVGIADTQIYDPIANSWSAGVSLPVANCGGVAAVVNGVLYVIGGYPYTDAVWAYSPRKSEWTAKTPMPVATTDMGVAVLKGLIYVIGGNTGTQNRVNIVESYNPSTNTWTEEAPLLVGKSEPSVAALGTAASGFTIVAADGYSEAGDTGDNEGYNPSTNTWSTLTSDLIPRNAACSGKLNGELFVVSGYPGYGSAYGSNEAFNLSRNSWKTEGAIPQPTIFSGSAVYNGKLYCIGGSDSFATDVLSNVQIYQP